MSNWFRKNPSDSPPTPPSPAQTSSFQFSKKIISLPSFEKYKNAILTSLRPSISIEAFPKDNLSWTQSKFGGLPYLPRQISFPTDSRGKFMYLLAQINFEEAPHLHPFPSQGILQIYLGEDNVYGLDFDNPLEQKDWKILYFPEPRIETAQTDFSFLPATETSPFSDHPFPAGSKAYGLNFKFEYMPVTSADYTFDRCFDSLEADEDFFEVYYALYSGDGHRIGGYPSFTQNDPREYSKQHRDKNILLLQIDSQAKIIWGDCGIANFLISESDLLKLDFSKVLYNWDCA